MVVGELSEAADLVVVGGGPGGYTAALRAAELGRDVTLVDDAVHGIGGVCLHEGCIPSKALIDLAHTVNECATLADLGLVEGGVRPDLRQFQGWKRSVIERLGRRVAKQVETAGVRILSGRARFSRPGHLRVTGHSAAPPRYMTYADVVLATGSRPAAHPRVPFSSDGVSDAAGALDLEELPEHLAVVGAGYVGVELATAFAHLGSSVILIETLPRPLPGISERASKSVAGGLAAAGVRFLARADVREYADRTLTVDTADGVVRTPADHVLVAVGRIPNTDDLGLDQLGVTPMAGGRLDVGRDQCLTSNVAAIGDITAGPGLAHKATAEAEVAVEALCGMPSVSNPQAVPEVVFSSPEVATVGVRGDADGSGNHTVSFPLQGLGRAAGSPGISPEGYVAITVEGLTGCVIGVEIVGHLASELIAQGALAIEMGATAEDLAYSVHAHPTWGEAYGMAGRFALPAAVRPHEGAIS